MKNTKAKRGGAASGGEAVTDEPIGQKLEEFTMTIYEMLEDAVDRGGFTLGMQLLDELEEEQDLDRDTVAEYHAYIISCAGI